MQKLLLGLLLFFTSVPAFTQIEHGGLIGAGAGFSMRDDPIYMPEKCYGYNNEVKANGMIGYRFRFYIKQKSFFDLDATMGFQWMQVYKYEGNQIGDIDKVPPGEYLRPPGHTFTDYIMPLAITASWSYRFTDKFYMGAGFSPTLYVKPQTVFDLSVMAKIGYRFSKRFEMGLSYQYGFFDIHKHFNNGPAMGRRGHFADLMLSAYIPFYIK